MLRPARGIDEIADLGGKVGRRRETGMRPEEGGRSPDILEPADLGQDRGKALRLVRVRGKEEVLRVHAPEPQRVGHTAMAPASTLGVDQPTFGPA